MNKTIEAPAPKFRVLWIDPETGTQYEKEYVLYGAAENCKMKAEKDFPGAKVFITDMAGVVINL